MSMLSIFASSFLLGLSGALMPGPLFTLAVERSAAAGLKGGFFATLGHAVTEFLLVVILFLGFGSILALPPVTRTIGIVGGGILLYMGWGMLAEARRGPSLDASLSGHGARGATFSSGKTFLGGCLVSVANPYWFLWWTTVGSTYLLLWGRNTYGAMAAFYLGHIAADFAWLMGVSAAITFGRGFISPGFYRILLYGLGGLLIALSLYFIYYGLGA